MEELDYRWAGLVPSGTSTVVWCEYGCPAADQDAVAEFRSEFNGRLAPEAVPGRIRKHTALIDEARWVANG